MKLAFIIQRYGTEILGGSEYHCRMIAERLGDQHDVEVLTTCAQSYITWENAYPEGTDRVRGVTIRRFPTAESRDIDSFNRYSEWIFAHAHTRENELEWLRKQGPWCPALLEYLRESNASYDALIFFTYLYAPTVLGLDIAPDRSILVPTAHDEPAIHLGIYREMFLKPAAIAYNTEVERKFLTEQFPLEPRVEETVGCGVDLPPTSGRRGSERGVRGRVDTVPAVHAAAGFTQRGATFRRRHRIHGPFVLYGGRIDPGKGCEELIEYFRAYVDAGGWATLVLMGAKLMPLPEEPFIKFAGLLSERERAQALEAATIVVSPSPYESLSLLTLEAFSVGTPVLANARSAVVVDHCLRANGGLFYSDRDEFIEGLNLLVGDDRLRAALGRQGREYVRRTYRWDLILDKYNRMISALRARS